MLNIYCSKAIYGYYEGIKEIGTNKYELCWGT